MTREEFLKSYKLGALIGIKAPFSNITIYSIIESVEDVNGVTMLMSSLPFLKDIDGNITKVVDNNTKMCVCNLDLISNNDIIIANSNVKRTYTHYAKNVKFADEVVEIKQKIVIDDDFIADIDKDHKIAIKAEHLKNIVEDNELPRNPGIYYRKIGKFPMQDRLGLTNLRIGGVYLSPSGNSYYRTKLAYYLIIKM